MNVIERLYEVWNRHDVEGVLEFFTDDVEYVDQPMGLRFASSRDWNLTEFTG